MKRALCALLMFVAACGGSASHVSSSASGAASHASPSAEPVEDYGPPPAGIPLFYVPDPRQDGWYVGIDWSGIPRGTIKLTPPPDVNQSLLQAPDGTAFLLTPFKGGAGQYLDRLGKPISSAESAGGRFWWSDDSRHLCTLDLAPSGVWAIGLRAPDGTRISSHPVALDPSIVQSGIIAIDFRSCSAARDVTVLAYNTPGRPTEVYAVRISDGAILLHQTHAADLLADVAASPDSSLIAESSNKSSGYLMGPTAPNTIVSRLADGSVVSTLDPSYGVLTFSKDGSVALVNTSPWASGVATHLALVRLSDGAILWRYDGDEELFRSWSRPDGDDIAVLLQAPGPALTRSPEDVAIVHPDGTATTERLR